MSRFWSRLVHDLTPYTPGEQPQVPNLIKLNTNENPYPPSPKVLSAIQQASDQRLKLYPDPNSQALKETIAQYHQLNPENVFVGNGSDEVLAHTFQALLKQDKPLLFPDITYSFYPVYCGLYDVDFKTVLLKEDFSININDYQQDCGAIIFPNPNAPTGRLLPLAQIEQLLQAHPNQVVVVDEAYIDFGGESALRLVPQYPNLLVTQTLSKSRSLAGLRVGFAVGHADLITALERVKNSFNSYPVDCLAEQGAIASFQDEAYFQQTRQKVMQTRARLSQFLQHKGFKVLPSAANFVFVSHPEYHAEEIALQLREQAIIVRYFNKPRINQYLRISIGSDAENKALCDALEHIIKT